MSRREGLSAWSLESLNVYIRNIEYGMMQLYCFGKSQQEAADQLGIAVEVLNSRLYRARQWIRKNYEKEYEEVVNWF